MSADANLLTGLYPGTFDPITRGHEDLIERSLRVVDRLVVGVAVHTAKEPLFDVEERVELIRSVTEGEPRIRVEAFDGLTVEYAREIGASVILRGLRAVSDFEYEFQMAQMNKHLDPAVEILFMAPDAAWSFLSASLVREVAGLGGDVASFVAPSVRAALERKLGAS